MSRRRRFFFLGCNNVTPVINGDGSATYTFNAATLAAAGQQVPTPTGQIEAMDILIDAREPLMSRTSPSTVSCRSRRRRTRQPGRLCELRRYEGKNQPNG